MSTAADAAVVGSAAAIDGLEVSAFRVPTDFPESDGTYQWDSTTIVIVEASAGGVQGLGYSYADAATARFIREILAPVVVGRQAMGIPSIWADMVAAARNLGQTGVASMAISAVDSCLWDLKARLLGIPLFSLLGAARDSVPVYGSGGFTSYPLARLEQQLGGWVKGGIPRVKMKIGRNPAEDVQRVEFVRGVIGPDAELFVDANAAYTQKQALAFAEEFARSNVTWFEEPVNSDDLDGLSLIRSMAPAGMNITAGEYGYNAQYFQKMLEAGAVDILQADATRCQGITGFLQAGTLCAARFLKLSSHCAPSLHLHACMALGNVIHMEYFHDHVRIEQMLFEGVPTLLHGNLYPDKDRPGMGLELKRAEARKFAVS